MSENSNKAGTTAGVGTAGGIGYVAAGMSASQITSTLATVGSVVGGGMAAGIAITAAAPIAVGVVVATVFDIFDL